MTYDVFKSAVIVALQERLPEDTRISIEPMMQDAFYTPDGLVISEPGYCDSPVIFLQYYYDESVRTDASVDDMVEAILKKYRRNRQVIGMDVCTFTDFSLIKDRIIYRLVNPSINPKKYEDVPLLPVLDLALTFYVLLKQDAENESVTSVLIHKSHLKLWGDITEQDLMALAVKNTPRLLPYQLNPIGEVLDRLNGKAHDMSCGNWEETSEESSSTEDFPDGIADLQMDTLPDVEEQNQVLYVLTNSIAVFGAGCVFYTGILEQFASHFRSDLYLIPSSVHEILLLPDYGCFSRKDLNDMVRDVNATVLKKEDILSDHVYYYAREQKAVSM